MTEATLLDVESHQVNADRETTATAHTIEAPGCGGICDGGDVYCWPCPKV